MDREFKEYIFFVIMVALLILIVGYWSYHDVHDFTPPQRNLDCELNVYSYAVRGIISDNTGFDVSLPKKSLDTKHHFNSYQEAYSYVLGRVDQCSEVNNQFSN